MATHSIIVTLISIFGLVASRPSILPTCNYNTYNMYMFKAFSLFSMKYFYTTTELCMEEFSKLGYNKNYCSATSILGFSSENILTTVREDTESSGSGEDIPAPSCKLRFNINIDSPVTQILGGDIAIYKIPNRNKPQSSRDEFIVTVMYTDTSGEHTSSAVVHDEWTVIHIDYNAGQRLETGEYDVDVPIYFTKNGRELTCEEAQNIFVIDCNRPTETNHHLSYFNYSPMLILITIRDSTFFNRVNGRKRRDTIATTDDECHLVSHQVSILDILGNTEDIELFGSEQVDIGLCVSRDDEGTHNSRCMPTEYTDLVYLAMDRKNKQMKIETVPKIIATEC